MNDYSSNPPSVAEDLVVFYDEFVEFQSYCSFLCDALSSMTIAQIELDEATRRGINAFSGDLKYRVEGLKNRLKRIQEKSCVDD